LGNLLSIQCNGCGSICQAIPIPADMLKKAIKSNDKEVMKNSKKLYSLKYVIVFCKVLQEFKVVHIGGENSEQKKTKGEEV
jgi:hypothetical protein